MEIFSKGNPVRSCLLSFCLSKTALSFVNYYFLSHVNENALSTSKKNGSECPLNGANLFFFLHRMLRRVPRRGYADVVTVSAM